MQENVTDDLLIQAFLKGDFNAFEVLYARHRKTLLSVINGYFQPDYATADDVFQQAWLQIIENLPRYKSQSYFVAWACVIARNLAINILRKKKRTQRLFVDEYDEALSAEPIESTDTLEYDDKVYESLNEAIQTLNPFQKEVLIMRQELIPFNDIAILQNCSLNTVLGRYHDAIGNIRKKINVTQNGDVK